MKYVIDTEVVEQHGFTLAEYFLLLSIKENSDTKEVLDGVLTKEMAVKTNVLLPEYLVTQHWNDEMSAVLLESDKAIPKQDRVLTLVQKMKEFFPKGLKIGSSAWRGNDRELSLRMKKFFKLYGDRWTDEQILKATEEYVKSFNGDYRFMQILKYFILKSRRIEGEEGNYIEDQSQLATFLEKLDQGEDINQDWTQTVI